MNESFYYPNRCLNKYLIELSDFTHDQEPLLIVTGERGMGKTALLSAFYLSGKAPADMLVLKGRESLTPEKLISTLVQEWHLDNTSEQASQSQMLANILQQMGELATTALLVIDNADRIPIATLAAIMYLCVSQKDQSMALQIILFGKPSFKKIIHSLHQPSITFNYLMLTALSLDETASFVQETMRSMQPLTMPKIEQATIESIYQQSQGIPHEIARLAEEQYQPRHIEAKIEKSAPLPEQQTVNNKPITNTMKESHPLDLVKPTQSESQQKSFLEKYGVKLLSVILLALLFVFLHQYEYKIHHEDIGYTAPTLKAVAPPPIVPEEKLTPKKPLTLTPKTKPSTIKTIKKTVKIAAAKTPKVSNQPAQEDLYHWQMMASPKKTVVLKAMQGSKLRNFDPYILSKQVKGVTWYSLNIGKFTTKAQAQAVLKQLPAHLNAKPWLVSSKNK